MSTENQQVEQQQVVTKEQVVAHLTDQIEVTELRVKLQKLNTDYAIARAEELKAIAFVSQMTKAPEEDETLTQSEAPGKKLQKK